MQNTENKFKYNGAWYIAVEQDGCRNCDFRECDGDCQVAFTNVAPCGACERQDNRNVIFVRSDVDNLGDE